MSRPQIVILLCPVKSKEEVNKVSGLLNENMVFEKKRVHYCIELYCKRLTLNVQHKKEKNSIKIFDVWIEN